MQSQIQILADELQSTKATMESERAEHQVEVQALRAQSPESPHEHRGALEKATAEYEQQLEELKAALEEAKKSPSQDRLSGSQASSDNHIAASSANTASYAPPVRPTGVSLNRPHTGGAHDSLSTVDAEGVDPSNRAQQRLTARPVVAEADASTRVLQNALDMANRKLEDLTGLKAKSGPSVENGCSKVSRRVICMQILSV